MGIPELLKTLDESGLLDRVTVLEVEGVRVEMVHVPQAALSPPDRSDAEEQELQRIKMLYASSG